MTFNPYHWHPMKPPVQRSLLVACTASLLDPKKQDHIAPRRYISSAIVLTIHQVSRTLLTSFKLQIHIIDAASNQFVEKSLFC